MSAERSLSIFLLAISGGSSVAQSVSNSTSEPASLSAIVVTATLDNSIGTSDSASAGVIDGDRLNEIPLLRPADVLENIPAWWSLSTQAAAKLISIICEASTSIMGQTLPPKYKVSRSTCRPMLMGRGTSTLTI